MQHRHVSFQLGAEAGASLADADEQADPFLSELPELAHQSPLVAAAGDPHERWAAGFQRGTYRQRAGGDGVHAEGEAVELSDSAEATRQTREADQVTSDVCGSDYEHMAGKDGAQGDGEVVETT